MIFVATDPLALGLAGLALMLSLVALLFVVFYVRKLALAASSLARDFYTVLDAHGYFDEYEEADEDDGDARDSDDSDDGDDEPTPPSDLNATALLPTPDVEVSEDEEEALLHVILHRDERRDYNSLSML